MRSALLAGIGAYALFGAEVVYGAAETAETAERLSAARSVCLVLQRALPGQTFIPGNTTYTYENQHYWSSTDWTGPACVFVPECAEEVSIFVRAAVQFNVPFAVRGGGHMPIPGYNNIDSSGILLSPSNLTTIELARDKRSVSIGPGRRWSEVYNFLQPYGLVAPGGRVGKVGVPGYMLGGGISFYSNQYGFGADNVEEYECVLADGSVVEANADNRYSDLFWALKGGGNSFCIVTRFDVKTYVSPQVWVGIAQYLPPSRDKYLDAVYNFGKYGSLDAKAAIIPTLVIQPQSNLTVYAAAKFYDGDNPNPTAFQNFTAPRLTPVADDFSRRPLSYYINETDALQPDGLRQEFQVVSSIVDRTAVQDIHDSFVSQVTNGLSGTSIVSATLTFQPITKEFILQGIKKGGNPQGVDISRAPYFWVVMDFSWTNVADDTRIYAAARSLTSDIRARLKLKRLDGGYLYMNDAGKGQPIFQNYPPENLARLKRIRAKYDPRAVYTRLMPGGWKVEAA